MSLLLGIRREDKNEWERRSPLAPDHVAALVRRGIGVRIQPAPRRVFGDGEYAAAGAAVDEDLSPCDLVLGVKEMPAGFFRPGGAYLFFSHTIKGQRHNLPMLGALLRRGGTLLDYELIRDERGRRTVFFGRHAGLAGMIDALWALGRRLEARGVATPFRRLEPAHRYPDLAAALAAVRAAGEEIAREGLPAAAAPLAVGVTGYGHVATGALEVLSRLPRVEVAPAELAGFLADHAHLRAQIVQAVYREEDLVAPREPGRSFSLAEYYARPERYRPVFAPHLEFLTVLVNGIYWDGRYPRLAGAGELRGLFAGGREPRLAVVADISCDVDGSLACTVRETHPGDPVYRYDPEAGTAAPGFAGPGLLVLAVGNLPCELPREASLAFGDALAPLLPGLARTAWAGPLAAAGLPDALAGAVVAWRGELQPAYRHLGALLAGEGIR